MKVLFTIPHYFRPTLTAPDGRAHGSVGADPAPRAQALFACLHSIHQTFAPKVGVLSHTDRQVRLLQHPEAIQADIILCTVQDNHLLSQLPATRRTWTHHRTEAQPLFLGYECHGVLRNHLGQYDYYCYLEDDIILHDPEFFQKLSWFTRQFGNHRLLQPNRFEAAFHHHVDKLYVDGDLPAYCTSAWQAVEQLPPLSAEYAGISIGFHSSTNPHAGCFFLNAAQMDQWVGSPHFLDRSDSFIGALESAATLGILREFQIYKPDWANAEFLEVQHHGNAYLSMIRS